MKKLAILLSAALLLLVFAGCQSAEPMSTEQPDPTSANIELPLTKQTAIEIAFKHAKVTNDEVRHLHAWQDTDDGVIHYDVDFRHGDYYYAYEISEQTGEILKLETEYDRKELPQTQLTAEEAQKIVLDHAGFTSDSVQSLTIEFDQEDHRYEARFIKDSVAYTYEVCAEFGKILDIDRDWDD